MEVSTRRQITIYFKYDFVDVVSNWRKCQGVFRCAPQLRTHWPVLQVSVIGVDAILEPIHIFRTPDGNCRYPFLFLE